MIEKIQVLIVNKNYTCIVINKNHVIKKFILIETPKKFFIGIFLFQFAG